MTLTTGDAIYYKNMFTTLTAPSPYQGCTFLAPSPLFDFAFFNAYIQFGFTLNRHNSGVLSLL